MKPRLLISAGDPAGIGAEIILKTFLHPELCTTSIPVVIGDYEVFAALIQTQKLPLKLRRVTPDTLPSDVAPQTLPVIDMALLPEKGVVPGELSADAGNASFKYVQHAVALTLAGKADAVVTAPINKEAWHMAEHIYDGHTGLLANMCATSNYAMMLTGKQLTVVLVTTHCAYKDAPALITEQTIIEKLKLTQSVLVRRGNPHGLIAVLGLNPHAGEGGVFGNEERDIIIPALKKAVALGIHAEGPFPPDTAFLPAFREKYDAHLCMYHDQGLIPLKMLCFADGVNVTLGLPLVRTSPDHGTAFNIAGTWQADAGSMWAAINEAICLVKG